MLEALGFVDVVLQPAKGAWRTDKRLDVYTFEGHATLAVKGERGHQRNVCSWWTMTEIVKSRGVIVDYDDMASMMLHPSPDGKSRIEGSSHARTRHA